MLLICYFLFVYFCFFNIPWGNHKNLLNLSISVYARGSSYYTHEPLKDLWWAFWGIETPAHTAKL
jgi:hypothetical protein